MCGWDDARCDEPTAAGPPSRDVPGGLKRTRMSPRLTWSKKKESLQHAVGKTPREPFLNVGPRRFALEIRLSSGTSAAPNVPERGGPDKTCSGTCGSTTLSGLGHTAFSRSTPFLPTYLIHSGVVVFLERTRAITSLSRYRVPSSTYVPKRNSAAGRILDSINTHCTINTVPSTALSNSKTFLYSIPKITA